MTQDAGLDFSALQLTKPSCPLSAFCSSILRGQATTLKRNGSDFSATILGSLFRSSYITIWTDVDGVYSADPRKVSSQGRACGAIRQAAVDLLGLQSAIAGVVGI